MSPTVLVFGLLCGLTAGVVANARGASFAAYLFFGILLGPFGIIIAAVAKPPGRPAPPAGPAPAWYSDPVGRHDHRWWDGSQWTGYVANQGAQGFDPVP